MMAELRYRAAAPSDGFGGITVPAAELDMSIEAKEYARRFIAEEDSGVYHAGCTDYTFVRAAVLTLEAFRNMNAGTFWLIAGEDKDGWKLVPALLRKAAEEYERAVREDVR